MPVQGSGLISVTTDASGEVVPVITKGNTTGGSNDFGGRIIRVQPNGTVTPFAYGFNTSGAQDFTSFEDSTLSIGFSADGNIFYAADDSGIWQFKTTADLADSTSGSLIGLSDLRALGVPYSGQNQAVAVVDTGVDGKATSFRGRVATGTNIITGGPGNQDLAAGKPPPAPRPAAPAGTGGGAGGTGGGHDVEHGHRQLGRRARHPGGGRDRAVRPRRDDRSDQHLQPVPQSRRKHHHVRQQHRQPAGTGGGLGGGRAGSAAPPAPPAAARIVTNNGGAHRRDALRRPPVPGPTSVRQ